MDSSKNEPIFCDNGHPMVWFHEKDSPCPVCQCKVEAGKIEYLTKRNQAMVVAGCALAEAALFMVREYDGMHRLLFAVSEWARALATTAERKA